MQVNPDALQLQANVLRQKIGSHLPLIGTGCSDAQYQMARAESDEAVSLAKYLICHLSSRHQAVTFAAQVGMPGYINMR